MKIKLIIWISITYFIISCSSEGKNRKLDPLKEKGKLAKSDMTFSPLDSLIKILIQDQFELKMDTELNKKIYFVSYNLLTSANKQDTFKIQTRKLVTINARRRKPIGNTTFIPRFTVQQIIPDSSIHIAIIQKNIEKIIYNPNDIMNDKIYDRVKTCDNQIYYISTQAKVFEGFVIHYDRELEKIIKSNKR